MIIAISIAVGIIILVLIGRTAKEKLVVSKEFVQSDKIFPPGKTRVEFDSVNKKGVKIVGNIYGPDEHQEGEKRPGLLEGVERFFKMLQGPAEKTMNKIKGSDHFEFYWKDEYVDQAVAGLDRFYKPYI